VRLLPLPWGVACAGIAFNASAAPMFMGLGDLPGGVFQSRVADVSVDGSVAVGYGRVGSGSGEAFRWNQAEEMVGLGTLTGANSSECRGVSTDGSVIVGVSSSTAWRWTEAGGMIDLGLPESGASNDVSADGSVISPAGSSVVRHSVSLPAVQWWWARATRRLELRPSAGPQVAVRMRVTGSWFTESLG